MKSLTWDKTEALHVETPLGIVNIRCGLSDMKGRPVDSIEVIPSCYAGEQKVVRRGYCNTTPRSSSSSPENSTKASLSRG